MVVFMFPSLLYFSLQHCLICLPLTMIPDVQSLTVKQVDTLETLSIYLPNCQITTVSVQSWTKKSSCENVLPCLPLCGQYDKLDFGRVDFTLWLVHLLPLLLITHGGIVSSLFKTELLS